MTPFPVPLTGRAAPILIDNVDTDVIIPSREIRSTARDGLADGLFAPLRYTNVDARVENPDFALNQAPYRDAQIIVGGKNFGCGSSREHAVWALVEWGIRAVIAPDFASIFRNNCIRNGVLPLVLPRETCETVAGEEIAIDLAAGTVTHAGTAYAFSIDAESRMMLLEGLDAIAVSLKHEADIDAWTARDRAARPWVYLSGANA